MILLPVLAVVSEILQYNGHEDYMDNGTFRIDRAYLWMQIALIPSTIITMHHLFIGAKTISQLPELKDVKVMAMTLCIQMSSILPVYQHLIIDILAKSGKIVGTEEYSAQDISFFTYHMLYCCEMVVVAFIQIIVFNPLDLKKTLISKSIINRQFSP